MNKWDWDYYYLNLIYKDLGIHSISEKFCLDVFFDYKQMLEVILSQKQILTYIATGHSNS